MVDLYGKRIVITGGTKGIGRSLAQFLSSSGASVCIVSRNSTEVEATSKELSSEGWKVFGTTADVSVYSECEKAVQTAVGFLGGIDILINNAGTIGEVSQLKDSNVSLWTKAITTNLVGSAYMVKAVLPFMVSNKKGKIINFAGAGVGSKNLQPNVSSYVASKFAIVGLTEALANELQADGVDINAVAPGAINTNITDYILEQGEEKAGEELYLKTKEQKEKGGDSIDNVTRTVAFLCSSSSDGITGKLISCKWDTESNLLTSRDKKNLFTLRRVDEALFIEK